MKRGIVINLVVLLVLVLVALAPVLLAVSMGLLGERYGCNMSGVGDFGPDPCTTVVSLLVVSGWSSIALLPLGGGLVLAYILGVVVFYAASLGRGRAAGTGASPLARGMFFSTLGAVGVLAVLVAIVAGVGAGASWYQSEFIGACEGLPAPAPLAGVRNGPLAISVRLQEVAPDEMTSLLVVSAQGQSLAQVDNLRRAADPAWSPDGQRLAFAARSWDSNQYGVYLMDRQGQVGQPLFADARLESSAPDWAPDGSLVLARWVEAEGGAEGGFDSQIFSAQADGSGLRSLPDSQSDEQPRVSPDGRQIVFVSQRDDQADIYRMDVDGSNVVRLTNSTASELHPAWSPDGKWIVYATNRDSPAGKNNYSLYIMAPDGSNQCRLTQGEDSQWHPAWSPDGMWIAYIALLERKVYLVRPDGTQTTNLPLPVAVSDVRGLDWAVER